MSIAPAFKDFFMHTQRNQSRSSICRYNSWHDQSTNRLQMSSYAKRFSKAKYYGDKTKYLEEISARKVIVHLGCTDWPNQIEQIAKRNLLHVKIMNSAAQTIGVDIDVDGINHLQNLYQTEDFLCGDISNSTLIQQKLVTMNPDYLLVPDVLEHIEDSRSFLLGVGKVLSETHAVGVFTTPNAFALKTFIPVIFGIDFTHPDHCSIHNEFTIAHAMTDANLHIKKIGYLSRDISERYGLLMQIVTKPFDWICQLFPRFSDTLYVEVIAKA